MGDCDNWSYEMKEEYKEALPKLANISGISMAGAFDVWGIYKTNTLTQGVYLQVSKFNHFRRPNAEISDSDSDSNTAYLTALRKVKEGDKITICYIDDDKSRWTREERRGDLKSVYNFDCACEVIATGEQVLRTVSCDHTRV